MKQYSITGMSCAACASRVQKAVEKVKGVTACNVNLLTNSMGVEGEVDSQEVIVAVQAAGYGASVKGEENSTTKREELKDEQTPKLLKRLLSSAIVLLVLMYFSMGVHMWGWWVPHFMQNNHVAMGLVQLLLTIVIIVINRNFFIGGVKSVLHGAPNMDTLVALGSGIAFGYSLYQLFAMTYFVTVGNEQAVLECMNGLYFESSAMILTLITVGKTLESFSKGKTTSALQGLYRLTPPTATVLKNGEQVILPVEQVAVGDIFLVKPGENIPVDGVVESGESSVNQASLTGESIPVDKGVGSEVFSGTVNTVGVLTCRATKVGKDTTLSKIIQTVADAQATKAPIQRIADKVSGVFVPAVLTIALIVGVVWGLASGNVQLALKHAITFLVISCPCALGLATPVAIMVGSGVGAKNGILFKNAPALESAGKAKIVVFDKTGTITKGTPQVCNVIAAENVDRSRLIQAAYSAEKWSEHPLAKAIVTYAEQENLQAIEQVDFENFVGKGIKVTFENSTVYGGNEGYISNYCQISNAVLSQAHALLEEGKTTLFFCEDNLFLGVIAVADQVKESSQKAIALLKQKKIHTVMLTGDNSFAAMAIARQVGIDEVYAEVLPDEKLKIVNQLKQKGKVIMVGDGINDAPALTAADVGFAVGAGTDIAIDSADVVLTKNTLLDVVNAVLLSKKTLLNIYENLFWAFIYNIICIPIAAGAFFLTLDPMWGAAAMSLSSFCVVSNALRLNFFKTLSDENATGKTKIITVKGMMCEHCEKRVSSALCSVKGVVVNSISHKTGKVAISLTEEVSDEKLKTTVTNAGYKVVKIQ